MIKEKDSLLVENVIDTFCDSQLVLETKGDAGKKNYYLSGIFQQADTPNENLRIYPRDVLNKNINEIQSSISVNGVVVELDHPKDGDSTYKRSIGVVTELNECDGSGAVRGKIKLADPDENDDVKRLISMINIGNKPGISSRGGSRSRTESCVEQRVGPDGKPYDYINDNYRLRTFDVVVYPSVQTARSDTYRENIGGVTIMTKEERLAQLRKLFQESSFDDIWALCQETGFDTLRSKIYDAVMTAKKDDIESIVKDRVAAEKKEMEAGNEAKIKEAAEQMASEALEGEGGFIVDLLQAMAVNGLVDESGSVPDAVWNEATAQWGAKIDNDLFMGNKKTGTAMRTKIPSAGSIHKEGAETANALTEEGILSIVTKALDKHPALQESEAGRQRRVFGEQLDKVIPGDSKVRDQVKESALAVFDSGFRMNEDQIRSFVTTQEKVLGGIGAIKEEAKTSVTPIPGQLGKTDVKPVSESKDDPASVALFG